MGRPVDTPNWPSSARQYARWQMHRPWMRFFWLWFVPGIVVVLGVAAQIHPILVGVVVALGAQAVWAWFNLRKARTRRYVAVTASMRRHHPGSG